MNKLFSILIVTILLLQLSVTQRISEKKCREYSDIVPLKPYPHMVWIREANKEISSFGPAIGVLISDQYILTSAFSDLMVNNSKVYFTEDEEFNIIDQHTHPLHRDTSDYNITLLKLERKVKLDGNHRPACLWTKEKFDDTEAFLLRFNTSVDKGYDFSKLTGQIVPESICAGLDYEFVRGTFVCTLPLHTKENENMHYLPAKGSPIQVKKSGFYIPDNHFILGIFSRRGFYYGTLNIGPKIYVYLDWIENIVWQSRNKNCGQVKVFGSPPYYGEFPWHVALHRKEERGLRKNICWGTLLNKNTVLTAAHCIFDENGVTSPNLLIVSLGKYNSNITNEDTQEVGVSDVIPHENFTLNYLENDIALLKLSHFISFSNYIEPICLTDDTNLFSTDEYVKAGWGQHEHQEFENYHAHGTLVFVAENDCRESDSGFFSKYLNDRNFCTANGKDDIICTGPGGGGGIVFGRDTYWYLSGILSLIDPVPTGRVCQNNFLMLFTDVIKFYDWIVDRL